MSDYPSIYPWRRLVFRATALFTLGSMCVLSNVEGRPALQAQQADKSEKKEEEVPKPPKDDFLVLIYKALDEKKATSMKVKEKYKHDKTEEDVEIVLSYFNWAVADDDYWNRQISVDTKTTDGFIIEKMVKSGFGELGYVKPGETKTQDVYRKEKITVSGAQSTATMADAEIGAAEKERFRKILEKIVMHK